MAVTPPESPCITSGRTLRKCFLQHLLYCCVTSPRMSVLRALHSNIRCLESPLRNGSTCHNIFRFCILFTFNVLLVITDRERYIELYVIRLGFIRNVLNARGKQLLPQVRV
jgi:hypothetical protein